MALTLPQEPLFRQTAFWPRISTKSWREIERVVSPTIVAPQPLRLHGALVEATLARTEAPILGRLRELGMPFLVDPQSLRFASDAYAHVAALRTLDYAPAAPVVPGAAVDFRDYVEGALQFQSRSGASGHVVPGVPLRDENAQAWQELNRRLLEVAVGVNGTAVEQKPLVALVAPGARALADPHSIVRVLSDQPVEAAYVLPLAFHPIRDGIEKLVRYTILLRELKRAGVGVIAGRVGAFGLVLQALGVPVFDSGLGEAESFNLAGVEREARSRSRRSKRGGGRKPVYLEPLKTTVVRPMAEAILDERSLRAHFVCDLPCCRDAGFEGLVTRRREHFLRTRHHEVETLAATVQAAPALALEQMHEQLRSARELATRVARVVGARNGIQPPDFSHLDRWLNVIARVEAPAALPS